VIRLFAIVDVQFLEDHVQLSVHAHEHLPEESELLTSRVISSAPEQAHMLTINRRYAIVVCGQRSSPRRPEIAQG
jgi:hypothetical protein